jgi:hypothetical protein
MGNCNIECNPKHLCKFKVYLQWIQLAFYYSVAPFTMPPDISYLWTYDLYRPICNAFDAGKSITRASERGWGPGNQDCFGPCEMASSHQASAIWGLKKSRFPGPNPLPFAQVMDWPASKALRTGPCQSEVHR